LAIVRAILLMLLVFGVSASFTPSARAEDSAACEIPKKSRAAKPEIEAPPLPEAERPRYQGGMPLEELSLYKTITYVTGATLTDQLWYLAIASAAAAAATGGIFLGVNAPTSSMMTYS
jgi:hypothetical protein